MEDAIQKAARSRYGAETDVRAEIEALTDQAMRGEVELEAVYARRLEILKPDQRQIAELRGRYKEQAVGDAAAVIAALQLLGHQVYVVSGGLAEPVREYALSLGIPPEHIVAVRAMHETLSGEWWRMDTTDRLDFVDFEAGELTRSDGKAAAIERLTADAEGEVLLVGDGVSDLNARTAVDLFVGFGGFVTRQRVEAESDVFVADQTLAPVLALAAGPVGRAVVAGRPEERMFELALASVSDGTTRFRDASMQDRFRRAFGVGERETDDVPGAGH